MNKNAEFEMLCREEEKIKSERARVEEQLKTAKKDWKIIELESELEQIDEELVAIGWAMDAITGET